MNSFPWWNGFTWWNGFWWPSFVKYSHGGASPWAEAAGGASRQRTMRAWHSAALGRIFGVEGHAQALRVRDSVLGTTRGTRVRLALRLHVARSAQAGVAHWAGATGRYGPGRAGGGGAVAARARWGQRRAATEARCQLLDLVLVFVGVESRGLVGRDDAVEWRRLWRRRRVVGR